MRPSVVCGENNSKGIRPHALAGIANIDGHINDPIALYFIFPELLHFPVRFLVDLRHHRVDVDPFAGAPEEKPEDMAALVAGEAIVASRFDLRIIVTELFLGRFPQFFGMI